MAYPMGGFNYGGYGSYGGYGMSNPYTGQGVTGQAVQTAPVHSTPLTPFEEANGELHRDSTSKKGLIIGGLSGAAAGAAIGSFVCPGIGTVIGGVLGLLGGGAAGDKIGNVVATQEDVDKDGKLDGSGISGTESGSQGFRGVF